MNKYYKELVLVVVLSLAIAGCAWTEKITNQVKSQFFHDSEFNTLVVKADADMEKGNWNAAIPNYEHAAELKPLDWDLRLKQAKAYERAGKLAQAFNVYQLIISQSIIIFNFKSCN